MESYDDVVFFGKKYSNLNFLVKKSELEMLNPDSYKIMHRK